MALINLRNALMTGKRLPYDAEVEYLESTGTEWIDTRTTIASTDRVIADFSLLATTDIRSIIFGARNDVDKRNVSCGIYPFNAAAAPVFCDFNNGDYNTYRCIGDTNTQGNYHVEISAIQRRIETPLGVTTNTAQNNQVFTTEQTCYIFSGNGRFWSGYQRFRGRFQGFKIERNGGLLRDFIPVRKGTVGYLYDRVSGKLFGNAGTGDFVLGPDVVPVEYIESHRTEYIDIPVSAKAGQFFGISGSVIPRYTNTSTKLVFQSDVATQFQPPQRGGVEGGHDDRLPQGRHRVELV